MIIGGLFVIGKSDNARVICHSQTLYLIVQVLLTSLTLYQHLAYLLARINPNIGGSGALNLRHHAILSHPNFLLVYITHFI